MERRVQRSDVIDTALGYQLGACADRAGLEALVLADQDGLLVAASPTAARERSEELAALLPLLARGNDYAGVLLDEAAGDDLLLVSSFRAAGSELYLCAIGDFDQATHREVARAKVGVRRILN